MNRRDAVIAALLGCLAAAVPAQAAPSRELVVVHEGLVEAGEYLPQNLEAFLRRVEDVAGWPKGSLRGKAFFRPGEAITYMKKHRSAFAILPVHQFLEGRKPLKLEILGRAVGLEGTKLTFTAVARRPRSFGEWHDITGLRLATVEAYDPKWLSLLFEARVLAGNHFRLLDVATAKDALAAVVDKKADLALLWPGAWNAVKSRGESGGDLEAVHVSGTLPPSVFVAAGKHARSADRKAMAAAVDKICKTTGATACGRMGILYIDARNDGYDEFIRVYDVVR